MKQRSAKLSWSCQDLSNEVHDAKVSCRARVLFKAGARYSWPWWNNMKNRHFDLEVFLSPLSLHMMLSFLMASPWDFHWELPDTCPIFWIDMLGYGFPLLLFFTGKRIQNQSRGRANDHQFLWSIGGVTSDECWSLIKDKNTRSFFKNTNRWWESPWQSSQRDVKAIFSDRILILWSVKQKLNFPQCCKVLSI